MTLATVFVLGTYIQLDSHSVSGPLHSNSRDPHPSLQLRCLGIEKRLDFHSSVQNTGVFMYICCKETILNDETVPKTVWKG